MGENNAIDIAAMTPKWTLINLLQMQNENMAIATWENTFTSWAGHVRTLETPPTAAIASGTPGDWIVNGTVPSVFGVESTSKTGTRSPAPLLISLATIA
jgi:hypothetical protein